MTKGTTAMAKGRETKAMLVQSSTPFNSKQLLKIMQKTPEQHIYQRPAKGGGKWDYVTGIYVKKVLNFVFGWMWSFEVKDHGREGNLIWVLGKLTINDKMGNSLITKEQFGRADIKIKKETKEVLDFGNDLKSATTDALKKCASELGIASDVYGKNEFKEVVINVGIENSPETSAMTQAKLMIESTDDKETLTMIYEKIKDSKILMIDEKNALKDIIKSKDAK